MRIFAIGIQRDRELARLVFLQGERRGRERDAEGLAQHDSHHCLGILNGHTAVAVGIGPRVGFAHFAYNADDCSDIGNGKGTIDIGIDEQALLRRELMRAVATLAENQLESTASTGVGRAAVSADVDRRGREDAV